MKTLTLSLTTSDGHAVEVPYTLPQSVRFDVHTPNLGSFHAFVDVSEELVTVNEVVVGGLSMGIDALSGDDASQVYDQAGDVCSLFDDAGFMGTKPSRGFLTAEEERALVLVADLLVAERKAHESWYALPSGVHRAANGLRAPSDPNHDFAPHNVAMAWFVHEHLVERAQDMATKAAKARQQAWEAEQAEHLREERCDSRDEVVP